MSNDETVRQALIARTLIETIPHAKALGMVLTEIEDGKAVITMDYDPQFIGDPETGVIHGGAVSALMDTCAAAAVMAHPMGTVTTATLGLRIDYMRPATPGEMIVAQAECYHVTQSVAFVRATACDTDSHRPVAMATGTFTIQRAAS